MGEEQDTTIGGRAGVAGTVVGEYSGMSKKGYAPYNGKKENQDVSCLCFPKKKNFFVFFLLTLYIYNLTYILLFFMNSLFKQKTGLFYASRSNNKFNASCYI